MAKVTVTCDRCKRQVEGMRIEGLGTSGFYEGSYWQKRYMNPHERILCDACMKDIPEYRKDYRNG